MTPTLDTSPSLLEKEEKGLLTSIGRLIAHSPFEVTELLLDHGVKMPSLPSPSFLTEKVVKGLFSNSRVFHGDLSDLLFELENGLMEDPGESHFIPLITAALGTASAGVEGFVSSKNNRKAVEAESKAHVEAARINAQSDFKSDVMNMRGRKDQSKKEIKLNQQKIEEKEQMIRQASGAFLLCFFGFLGFRYWKSRQNIPVTN